MKRYFKAKIKEGKFISNKQYFKDSVASLPDGDYLHLLIKVSDRNQRENQNYYFAQLGEWADTGYSREELHEIVKNDLFVQLFDAPLSTTELTREQWSMVFFNLEVFLITKFENV